MSTIKSDGIRKTLGTLPDGMQVKQVIYIVEDPKSSSNLSVGNQPIEDDFFEVCPSSEDGGSSGAGGAPSPAGVVCCCHRERKEVSPENPLIGLPSPVSYFAFGATVLLANLPLTGAVEHNVFLTTFCIFIGGYVQFVSGFFELINKNTVGCFISTGYGAYNLVNGYATKWAGTEKAPSDAFMGGVYFVWMFFALTVFGMCCKGPIVSIVLFILVVLNFFFCAVGTWGGNDVVLKIAGYDGSLAGIMAMYVAIAFALKSAHGFDVLPLINHTKFKNFRW